MACARWSTAIYNRLIQFIDFLTSKSKLLTWDRFADVKFLNICLSDINLPKTFNVFECLTEKDDGSVGRLEKLALLQMVSNAIGDLRKAEELKKLVKSTCSHCFTTLAFIGSTAINKLLIETCSDGTIGDIYIEPNYLRISMRDAYFAFAFPRSESELNFRNFYKLLEALFQPTTAYVAVTMTGNGEGREGIEQRIDRIARRNAPHLTRREPPDLPPGDLWFSYYVPDD